MVTDQQSYLEITTVSELAPRKRTAMLRALELLVGPGVQDRRQGLEQLLALDAQRRSPLGAAVLAHRIVEPDLALRREILRGLAKALRVDPEGKRPPERVRRWLRYGLGHLRMSEICALLEVVSTYPEDLKEICCIVNACSSAGDTLVRILSDRKMDLAHRVAATEVVGEVGFLDAKPALEAIMQRIVGWNEGQMQMGFAQLPAQEAEALLPVARAALQTLREAAN